MSSDDRNMLGAAGIFIILAAIPTLGIFVFSLLLFVTIMYLAIWMLYKMDPKLWKEIHKSNFPLFKIMPDLYKLVGDKGFDAKPFKVLAILSLCCLGIQFFMKFLINIIRG